MAKYRILTGRHSHGGALYSPRKNSLIDTEVDLLKLNTPGARPKFEAVEAVAKAAPPPSGKTEAPAAAKPEPAKAAPAPKPAEPAPSGESAESKPAPAQSQPKDEKKDWRQDRR